MVPYPKEDDYRYNSMGGINQKVSKYLNNQMEFISISNMDFQTPGSLSKRWGSGQYFGQSLAGKVDGLFEYIQNSGSSFLYAMAGGTLGLAAADGFSSIYSGSTAGASFFASFGSSNIDRWTLGSSLNADFSVANNQCFITNQKSFIKTVSGTSFYFFGLPRLVAGPQSNNWQTFIGGSGVVNGLTGIYYYKAAWVNSYGMQGAPTVAGTGGYYSTEVDAAGATAIILKLTGYTAIGKFEALVPPNFDIQSIAFFRAGPFATGLSTGSLSKYITDSSGQTYQSLSNIENQTYTYVGSVGVSSGSFAATFLDTNTAGGITLCNFNILPWDWYRYNSDTWALGFTVGSGLTLIPSMIETYSNRIWMSGIASSPDYVWFSEFNEPEHFEADFNVAIGANDGPVTALKSYNGNLIIFKEHVFYQLTGNDPTNYIVNQISSEYGCLSNRSVCEYGNLMVFLDEKGVIQFNGANIEILSTKIDPIFSGMNIAAAKVNSCITYDKQRNQLLVDIPVNGSNVNNLTVVYDIINKCWTTYQGYFPAITSIVRDSNVFYGGYSGLVSFFNSNFGTDNGTIFNCDAQSGFAHDMGYSITKLFRRLFIDVVPQGASSIVNVSFYQDYGSSIVQTMAFAQAPFQSRLEIGIPAKSLSVEFSFGSTTAFTLNGFTFEYRYLRSL